MTNDASDRYCIPGVNFDALYNRNERRIIKALKQALADDTLKLSPKDIQDVYALALNKVPAHYVHQGTIVLRANVTMGYILGVVTQSIEQVQKLAKP